MLASSADLRCLPRGCMVWSEGHAHATGMHIMTYNGTARLAHWQLIQTGSKHSSRCPRGPEWICWAQGMNPSVGVLGKLVATCLMADCMLDCMGICMSAWADWLSIRCLMNPLDQGFKLLFTFSLHMKLLASRFG